MKALKSELLKAFLNPVLYVSLILLAILTPTCSYLSLIFQQYMEKDFNKLPAFLVFSYGCEAMIPLSGYIIMAFSCMIFAGEFDRGTIKNLLTRPVTRTNLYVAKVITATVIATMLFLVVVWSSAAFGLVKGELGAIWADQSFQIRSTFMEMMSHTMLAVMMSFLSILCLVMLGVVISNVINNSGYAVAAGLILMLILSIASGMARENARPYFFNYYIGYSFETLRNFALGSATARWDPKIMEHALFGQTGSFRVPLYLIVPLTYSLVLIGISYIIFKFKQVIA